MSFAKLTSYLLNFYFRILKPIIFLGFFTMICLLIMNLKKKFKVFRAQ